MPAQPLSNESASLPKDAIRILVVDDSRLQRRILMSALASSGYVLDEAASGEEALERCRESPPDIVISDWMMPGMTGLDLCTAVRADRGEDYVYFIILTSKSEKEELAQALKIGADDFLSKPFSADELVGRITAGERLLRMGHELRDKNRLISTTLTRMQEMNAALDRDLIEARKLQMSLSPREPLTCGPWTINFALHPSGHIGGNLIGSFPAGPGKLGIYSFDVSGHGIASALIGARLASWMSDSAADRNVALENGDNGEKMLPPTDVCLKLNERFLDQINTGHYFTAVVGELDLNTGHFVFAQAGHPHPVLQTAEDEKVLIGNGGPPIGLLPDVTFDSYEATIRARPFEVLRYVPPESVLIAPEDRICTTILTMLNVEGIVLEPAGALSVDVLPELRDLIRGKRVVCITTGGNFDFERLPEVKERAQRYSGIKKYLILRMPQRPGALRDFLELLGPEDDIARFEYLKKSARNTGSVLIGIEAARPEDFGALFSRLADAGFAYRDITDDPTLAELLI